MVDQIHPTTMPKRNFDDVLKQLTALYKGSELGDSIYADIEHMSKGGDLEGYREKAYPGWTDDDFERLLVAYTEFTKSWDLLENRKGEMMKERLR